MPGKYSHVKKRSAAGLLKPGASTTSNLIKETYDPHHNSHHSSANSKFPFPIPPNLASLVLNPHIDRSITQALTTISQLERTIARIILLRFEHDLARLFSTHLHRVSLLYLPTLVLRCVEQGGYGWLVWNGDGEEIKDFFRAVVGMDMREAGERVATKSVLWSYTALREFALSNNVSICPTRGLHSLRLLPYFPALKAHLDALEAVPPPSFVKPPFLGKGMEAADMKVLEEECEKRWGQGSDVGSASGEASTAASSGSSTSSSSIVTAVQQQLEDWRLQLRYSYTKVTQTLWRVAREEFSVTGYGLILREKLTVKWCECGCSTDHLGEVCERSVREEEEGRAGMPYDAKLNGKIGVDEKDKQRERVRVRIGKQKEWDGRGSGVYGWETGDEEDIWEVDLDFGGGKNKKTAQAQSTVEPDSKAKESDKPGLGDAILEEVTAEPEKVEQDEEAGMTIGEMMEWRFVKAEREKEAGNNAFRKGLYRDAVKHYEHAYEIEPEMPHYQLNLAAAHLKLNNWIAAEQACTMALGQHRSSKGLFRRAKARKMLGKIEDAIEDLRAIIRLKPTNEEAITELISLLPPSPPSPPSDQASNSNSRSKPIPQSNSESKTSHEPESELDIVALYEQIGLPRPKRQKPPPFIKTKADERKLRILPLPAGSTETGFGNIFRRGSNGTGNGRGRAGKGRGKEKRLKGTAADYGVVYLEWDRYVVKRAD